jgi:hypothetical protein
MILPSLPYRSIVARTTMAVFMAAQMLGWITYAQASESAAPTPPPPAPPPPNALTAVRRSLREFDRFLDHHPLLEDRLRLNPRLIANQNFLKENSELRVFLRLNPSTVEGLQAYPRYFLYRALIRQANAPLEFRDISGIKDLLQQQPKLEQMLTANPELIRDQAFLETHPAVRDFLLQHPELGKVFLPRASVSTRSK